jgi:putative ABC transport system permease protein
MKRAAHLLLSVAVGCSVTAVAWAQMTTVRLNTATVSNAPRRLQPDTTDASHAVDASYVASGASRADADAPDDLPGVLLSRQLMEDARLAVGDEVTLATEADGTKATKFRVRGLYEPTPDPRKFSARRLEARLHLPDLVALTSDPLDPGSAETVNGLNLALANRADAGAVAAAVAQRLPGTTVQRTAAGSTSPDDPFVVLERFHWAIAVVTVTGSTAFLLALMIMRAEERREIIGILRLMGVASRSILLQVLFEGLLIAVAGAVFGIVVAVAAHGLINAFFQWRYDTTLVFVRVTPLVAWEAVIFAIPLGVMAGLAASWTLLRRSVVSLVGR